MHATMEHMTIWGLISDASLLVKGVMLTLLLASLLSWFLIVRRSAILRRSERDMDNFAQRLRAQGELNALQLFKGDMGAFQRMYAFLSQIFDYGNTAIEKRFIFFKRLLPLLEFGREREGIDLSKVLLTHHTLRDRGRLLPRAAVPLGASTCTRNCGVSALGNRLEPISGTSAADSSRLPPIATTTVAFGRARQ